MDKYIFHKSNKSLEPGENFFQSRKKTQSRILYCFQEDKWAVARVSGFLPLLCVFVDSRLSRKLEGGAAITRLIVRV